MKEEILIKQDIQELLKLLENGSNFFANKRALSYKRIIKTALQEQLDRLEGCGYCAEAIDERLYFNKFGIQIYIDKDDTLVAKDLYGYSVNTYLNYCPKCGRKLRGGEDES